MPYCIRAVLAAAAAVLASGALAGGSDYGVAPDGSIFISVMSGNRIARFDAAAQKFNEWDLPEGAQPHGVLVAPDGAGRVWANEIQTDTVAVLDPGTEKFRVLRLPSKNVGIRKAIIDAQGRYWYMGSHNGRLGVIE